MQLPPEAEVLGKLVAWGESEPAVRALVLTSTRATGGGDLLSDYDVIVAARDVERLAAETGWIGAYGPPAARWSDRHELRCAATWFHGVVYEDGVRVDYTLWPDALLDRVAEESSLPDDLDVGYRVLLDKDGQTAAWAAPTHRAHIPGPPAREQYDALVSEFWWDTTYVAKALW